MFYLHTKLHLSSYSNSLVIAFKPNTFHAAAILLYCILQRKNVFPNLHIFRRSVITTRIFRISTLSVASVTSSSDMLDTTNCKGKAERIKSPCLIKAPHRENILGSGGIAPPFLISAQDGGEWSPSRPRHFTPRGRNPRYPLYRKVGGPQSRSGRCGVQKISCSCSESNPGRSARSLSLYQLGYPGSYC
jgi:hypothetical protein